MANLLERFHINFNNEYDASVDPEGYDRYVREKLKRDKLADSLVQGVFIPHIPPLRTHGVSATILDIAAGTGILSRSLADVGYAVTASDRSEKALSYLHVGDERISTMQADMNKSFPFPPNSYDGVTTLWANRFIEDAEHFSEEVYRVLKRGGSFIWPVFITEAPMWKLKNGIATPTLPYSLANLLEQKGFSDVRVEQGDKNFSMLKERIHPRQVPTLVMGIKGNGSVRESVSNTIFAPGMQLSPV